jgi:hypothetical protein
MRAALKEVLESAREELSTSTNSPTLQILGGSLTLLNDIVQESTGGTDAAIALTGGTLDLDRQLSIGDT